MIFPITPLLLEALQTRRPTLEHLLENVPAVLRTHLEAQMSKARTVQGHPLSVPVGDKPACRPALRSSAATPQALGPPGHITSSAAQRLTHQAQKPRGGQGHTAPRFSPLGFLVQGQLVT